LFEEYPNVTLKCNKRNSLWLSKCTQT